MAPTYDRAGMERRIYDALVRGATLQTLERREGFPSRSTLLRWRRESPRLAAVVDDARATRRALMAPSGGPCFDYDRAQALLAAYRRGAALAELLGRAGHPKRRMLDQWKRERPDFAAELAAAAALSRRLRGTRWRSYDPAAADRVICRVNAGEPLARVLADPDLPGAAAVARWRRQRPGFDYAMRMASLAGHRRRMAKRRKLEPKLADAICRRLADGATMDSLGAQKGMPHRATLQRWMRRDWAFAARVRAACEARDEPLAEEALSLAETATPETLEAAKARIAEIRRTLGRRGVKRGREAGAVRCADFPSGDELDRRGGRPSS